MPAACAATFQLCSGRKTQEAVLGNFEVAGEPVVQRDGCGHSAAVCVEGFSGSDWIFVLRLQEDIIDLIENTEASGITKVKPFRGSSIRQEIAEFLGDALNENERADLCGRRFSEGRTS
eukprot:s3984_g13.t2